MKVTWKPHEEHGKLSTADKKELPDSVYAFPEKRKEPMTDASHVRNAIARFDQVKDVTDNEREQAFANIQAAARHYQVDMPETLAAAWKEASHSESCRQGLSHGRAHENKSSTYAVTFFAPRPGLNTLIKGRKEHLNGCVVRLQAYSETG